MRVFLQTLFSRSWLLMITGTIFLFAFFASMGLWISNHILIGGENIWAKPTRYALSFFIMHWTIASFNSHLNKSNIKSISVFLIGVFSLAVYALIFVQSLRGTASHFNEDLTTPFNTLIKGLLLISSVVLWIGCLLYTIAFFNQRKMPISQSYTWSIRCGLLLFLFSGIIGGTMFLLDRHTIGSDEVEQGLVFFDWSTKAGDLRIPLFLSIHALQLIPFLGFYVLEGKQQVINLSLTYAFVILVLFILALAGISLF
ncbi:MAG: hypothetical protein ACKO5C_07550 [Ferruginibacter sp.]